MKREMGFARCGLACCMCSDNDNCKGCTAGDCTGKEWCHNRKCSMEKGIDSCMVCENVDCREGMFERAKPLAFAEFIRRYGEEELLNCLERNEKAGIIYHKDGFRGDYDELEDVEAIISFIRTGKR